MRKKTIEIKLGSGAIGHMGIGSHAESDWVVEKITYIGIDEHEVLIICDCIHAEDYNHRG